METLLATTVVNGQEWELLTLAVYLGGLLWIGIRSAREIHTADDYTVAGRQLPWIVVLATTAATMVGGGASIGFVGKAYAVGVGAAVITCAWHLQLIFTGVFIAPRLRGMNLVTVAQYFGRQYGELARRIAVVSGIVFLVGALVAQMAAMGTVTETVLQIDRRWAVLLGAAVVVLYSTIGGIRAVVKTDVLQFVVLVGGIATASGWLLWKHGGWTALAARAEVGMSSFEIAGEHWSGMRVATLFGAFLLGETLVPPYAVRCFIAKDAREARMGVAGGGLFLLLFLPVATFTLAMAGRVEPKVQAAVQEKYQEIRAADPTQWTPEKDRAARANAAQVAFPALMRTTFPPLLAGIMIAALIAAVMSSADSCLSCLATSVMEDIYRMHIDPQADDARLLQVARWSTVVAGVIAAGCALAWSNIAEILEFIYDFWAPAMVLPFLVGVFAYRPEKRGPVVVSMIAGPLATILWRYVLDIPYDISPALFGFAVAVVVYLCLRVLTSRTTVPSEPDRPGQAPAR